MKFQLQLRIVGWSGPLEPDGSTEVHLCLTRDFDLPFTPYEGLRILLPHPDEEHPDFERYSQFSEGATEYVSFLTIENLHYDIGEQQFCSVSYLPFSRWDGDDQRLRTLEELKTMGQILIHGYGFEPFFTSDEEILKQP